MGLWAEQGKNRSKTGETESQKDLEAHEQPSPDGRAAIVVGHADRPRACTYIQKATSSLMTANHLVAFGPTILTWA